MATEAAWHMKRNGLSCAVVHGAVGLPPGESSTTFHVHPSSSASSVLAYQEGKQHPVKGRITQVTVPAISVASEWKSRFGDTAVDLLKLDVEGKELDFVTYEGAFLERHVRALIVEWHKWSVTLPQLDAQLASIGFARREVPRESETTGVALYENSGQMI
jgi:FkbM family methyltransferase